MVLDGNPLENLHDFRKKGIGDFGNDQAKNAAPPRNQCSSLRIRIIAKLLDHLPNPLGQLRIDGGDMINGTRYCGGRYLGMPGDFTDIHNLANAGAKESNGFHLPWNTLPYCYLIFDFASALKQEIPT